MPDGASSRIKQSTISVISKRFNGHPRTEKKGPEEAVFRARRFRAFLFRQSASTIEFRAGRGPHGLGDLRLVRAVVPAHIDGLALGRDQFGGDLGLVFRELLGDAANRVLEFLVLVLPGQRLGPVQGQVEVAAAVVDLADLAGGRLVVVEELGDGLRRGCRPGPWPCRCLKVALRCSRDAAKAENSPSESQRR